MALKKLLDKIPPFFKNFYFITGFVFLVWVLFFDRNDIITHIQLNNRLDKLEKQKAFYGEKFKEVEKNRTELQTDKEQLEKFAREKYLMKKDNEDLYVIEKKEEE